MKSACFVFVFFFSVFSAQAIDKVVYGQDNRMEVLTAPTFLAEYARSTAAMISKDKLEKQGKAFVLQYPRTLQKEYRLCRSERFLNQPTSADCSGFLIAPDVLVTAGHCMQGPQSCKGSYWVFDYRIEDTGAVKKSIPETDVYTCKQIIAQKLDSSTMDDYAVIRLDRIVKDRKPLAIRKEAKVLDSASLVVIGHPSGLPSKITDSGTMRENNNRYYFTANLDTFSGNSGSVVLDAQTGLVEGILVRGEDDYVEDEQQSCYRVNVCKEGECRGEDVTRITNLAKALKTIGL